MQNYGHFHFQAVEAGASAVQTRIYLYSLLTALIKHTAMQIYEHHQLLLYQK